MNDWRIRRRYGYGVAQLRLPAPPPRNRNLGLVRGVCDALRELTAADRWRLFARASGTGAILFVAVALVVWNWRLAPQPEPELFEPTRMEWFVAPPPLVPVQQPVPQPTPRPLPIERVVVASIVPPERVRIRPEPKRETQRPVVVVMDPVSSPEPEAPTPVPARVALEPLRSVRHPQRPAPTRVASTAASTATFPAAAQPRLRLEPLRSTRNSHRPTPTRVASTAPFPTTPAPIRLEVPFAQSTSRFARGLPAVDLTLPSVSSSPLVFPSSSAGSAHDAREFPTKASRASGRPEFPLVAVGTSSVGDVDAVSLSSLPSCRSDAEEEILKQQVLATVEVQVECNSDAGSWMFLQTRNLNAFLMNVKRATGRPQANRCDELRLALVCLSGAK